jgi:hypothetical protein
MKRMAQALQTYHAKSLQFARALAALVASFSFDELHTMVLQG